MSNLTVENVYTRQKAKELARKHFWKLTGMILIVFGIGYALSYVGTLLMSGFIIIGGDGTASLSSSGIPMLLLGVMVSIIGTLLGAGLSLGLVSSMLDLCRGKRVPFWQLFCRMGKCLKAWGLNLWVGLKLILWALPVYAILAFVVVSISTASSYNALQINETTEMLMMILPFVAIITVLALVIPAALRYMLSTYVLADDPGTRVFDCVRQSKAMMKGHKWQAFKLAVPPILILYGWMLAISIPFGIVMALVDSAMALLVVSILVYIALIVIALIISLRISLGYCLFYLKRTGEMPAIPPEEAERIVCWQPGKEPQPAGEPVASANDEHIAGWQPTEEKPDEE